ncbi:MAG: hypothetical protein ACKOQY_09140 [Bacteroidota bacterium]
MKKPSYILLSISVFGLVSGLFSSCKDDATDEPPHVHAGELITTVQIALTDTITGDVSVFSYSDLDGPGGNNPVSDTLSLLSGRVYAMSVLVLDENATPTDTISAEIQNEADVHLFVYTSSVLGVQISDQDINGQPLGLSAYVSALSVQPGTLRVQLRHYNSAQAKISGGSAFSTDVDFSMPVQVD